MKLQASHWVWQKRLSPLSDHLSLPRRWHCKPCAGSNTCAARPLPHSNPTLIVSTSNCLQTLKPTSLPLSSTIQCYQEGVYSNRKRISCASLGQTISLCSCIPRVALLKCCWCWFGSGFPWLYHPAVHQVKSWHVPNCFIKSVASQSTVEIL